MTGECKYCFCTEDDPCFLRHGETCGWIDDTKTCCTAPDCAILYVADWPASTVVTL